MLKSIAVTTAALFALLAATPAPAATSGKVELKGTVPALCEIKVTDLGQSLNLTNGENNKKVANITETCNDHDGYLIRISSANAGNLATSQGAKIGYTVNYSTLNNKALNGEQTLTRNNAQFNQSYDLQVNIAKSDTRTAGDYRDTITVTIAAR